MRKRIISMIFTVSLCLSCFSSCGNENSENTSQYTTSIDASVEQTKDEDTNTSSMSAPKEQTTTESTTKKTTATTTTTTTTTTKATTKATKPAKRPVPDIIKKMLETTDPSYGGQAGGPAAGFMTYYGYLGHEGTQQDEMWFQDMDGDGVPELVVGGYSVGGIPEMGQGQVHCYEVQNYKNNKSTIIHLRPDYDNKTKHGHNAFLMQAYKDKSGSLVFLHTQFNAFSYAPEMDPRFAGTFKMYQYSFKDSDPDKNKKEILSFSYDPSQSSVNDAFSFYSPSDQRLTVSQGKAIYNNYYSGKTPLRANIKPINYQNYMYNMTQEQRKQALMDSYYSCSYTVDTSIQPYAKSIFDKI